MPAFETALIFLGSFGLGLSHAFEADHMTAVSAFVARSPNFRQAVHFGARWALGHALSLLVFGSVLFGLKLSISDSMGHGFEKVAGIALIAVGVRTLLKTRPAHFRAVSSGQQSHESGRGSIWVGAIHGMAGTAAFLAQFLLVTSRAYSFMLAFTVVFGLGVFVAMSFYAGLLGILLQWSGQRFSRATRKAQALVGLWSCVLGVVWMVR